jgi:peptidoglycan hydrolase-like protein with peptidoglycan-binding domain
VAHKYLPFCAAALIIGTQIYSDAAEDAQKKKSSDSSKSPTQSATKKSTSGAAVKKSTSASVASTKKTGTSSASSKAGVKRRVAKRTPPRPRGQQAPTKERYQEIQQALIERRYLGGPPTGIWGPESADALRRFQKDQNIEATGKLDSLSLIALGLGPKRNATALARPTNESRSTEGNKGP